MHDSTTLATMPPIPELAISVRQPWAWAIIYAGKDIENRSRATSVRGPIAIHASKAMTMAEYNEDASTIAAITGIKPPRHNSSYIQYGGIIGTTNIIDDVIRSSSPWFFGPHGYVLEGSAPLPLFFPTRGRLGFFNWRSMA